MKLKKNKMLRYVWLVLVIVATLSLLAASLAPIFYGL